MKKKLIFLISIFYIWIIPYIMLSKIFQIIYKNFHKKKKCYNNSIKRYIVRIISIIYSIWRILILFYLPQIWIKNFLSLKYGDVLYKKKILNRGVYLLILVKGSMLLRVIVDYYIMKNKEVENIITRIFYIYENILIIYSFINSKKISRLLFKTVLFYISTSSILSIKKKRKHLYVKLRKSMMEKHMTIHEKKIDMIPLTLNYLEIINLVYANRVLIYFDKIFTFIKTGKIKKKFSSYILFMGICYIFNYIYNILFLNTIKIANIWYLTGIYIPGIFPKNETSEYLKLKIYKMSLISLYYLTILTCIYKIYYIILKQNIKYYNISILLIGVLIKILNKNNILFTKMAYNKIKIKFKT